MTNKIKPPGGAACKTALITGASGCLGYELCKLFAKDKINLVLVARNETKLKNVSTELKNQYGVGVTIFSVDLSEHDAAQDLYETINEQGLSIDYLVNNAGIGSYGDFSESDYDLNEKMINLNITALVQLTRLLLPGMLDKGSGRILNVASLASYQPGGPGAALYYASKSFVLSFNRGLSIELKGTCVTATALCPGPMKTGFEETAGLSQTRLYRYLNSSQKTNAEKGYRAMHQGKMSIIPGMRSWILALGGENPFRTIPLWVNTQLLR